MIRPISYSEAKVAKECMRKHHLRYDLGYRPVATAEELSLGSVVDAALGAWWSYPTGGDYALIEAHKVILEKATGVEEQLKASEMLRGYHARWNEERVRYRVIGVQVPFEAPFVHPYTGEVSARRQIGVVDALVEDRTDGRILIVDHKTSSEDISPASVYWQRLRLDSQISMYFSGVRALGYDVQAFLYDVLGKPSIKPYKATPEDKRKYKKDGTLYANQRAEDETADEYRARLREDIATNPDAYYQRGEIVRLEKEIADHLHDLWALTEIMDFARRTGHAPRNVDSCFKFRRPCEYLPVCRGEASITDENLYRISKNPNQAERGGENVSTASTNAG